MACLWMLRRCRQYLRGVLKRFIQVCMRTADIAATLVPRLTRNQSGNIAIFTAIAAPCIILAVGSAIDMARAVSAKKKLQDALDAAALAAIHQSSLSEVGASLQNFLEENYKESRGRSSVQAKVISFDGSELQVEGRFSLETTFAKIFHVKKIPISTTSVVVKPAYDNIYFSVDLSSSTGVGATPTDRAALGALTRPYMKAAFGNNLPQGCEFACHRRQGWEPSGKTIYQMARDAGIRLREDELILQFNQLVDLLLDPSDPAAKGGLRRISVIGFSSIATQLASLSTSASSIKSALGRFRDHDRYETDYRQVFNRLNRILGRQGDGSRAEPLKTLVLITDGVNSRDFSYSQKPIDNSLCDRIKSRGFKLAVIEIQYPKLVNNFVYNVTVRPVENKISPALESCASPGWYFKAENHEDVPVKFQEFKEKFVTSRIRISN